MKRKEERFFVERWTQILGNRVKESSLQGMRASIPKVWPFRLKRKF